jgi:hypothetical protein
MLISGIETIDWPTAIRGAIPSKHEDGRELTTKEFFDKVEKNFKSSSKTYASTLIMKMLTVYWAKWY